MSMSTKFRRLSLLGAVSAVALTVSALTVPLAPAKADWAGVQIGPFGIGVGTPGPYYGYPYYYHPYAYGPYYDPYVRPYPW